MRGIVFDFDGVIAQSMEQHAEAYRQVLAPLGIPVTREAVFALEGARSETIIRDLATAAGMTVAGVNALAEAKQAAFRAAGPSRLYPGAEAVVRDAQRLPCAIVTGTRRANLEALIPDWVDGFAALVCQEDYTKDKPDPEPYLRAAELLGIDPAELTCVENAVRGIASARAAGYGRIIAITTTMPAAALGEADVIVADHEALRAALA